MSTHKNGSHLCPKSLEAHSPNAENNKTIYNQQQRQLKERRPTTHDTDHTLEGNKKSRARGGGWTRGEAIDPHMDLDIHMDLDHVDLDPQMDGPIA
jgi:hypothetical protein